MTARAHVEHNFPARGVDVYLGDGDRVLSFDSPITVMSGEAQTEPSRPLCLSDDMARALYEALAEHYGHSGHDTRALRQDYNAERKRVDKMLDALLRDAG